MLAMAKRSVSWESFLLPFRLPYLTTLLYLYLQSDTEVHIHWKGAAELLLASCRSWLSVDGSVKPMNSIKVNMHPTCPFLVILISKVLLTLKYSFQHSEFKKSIDDMAVSSLRCVAFAYCPWEAKKVPTESLDKWKLPEDDLTLIGVVGIKVVYSEPLKICTSSQ